MGSDVQANRPITDGTQRLEVLVVGDEPTMRTIIALSLELDPAIFAREARSGLDAIEDVIDGRLKFDLILIDAVLPDIPTTRLLEALRRLARDGGISVPPSLVLINPAYGVDLSRIAEAGATAVLHKPFDPLTLGQHVRRLVHG